MSYFIFDGTVQLGKSFIIKGEEASHILQSRRIRPGEIIRIQDRSARRYDARVEESGSRKVTLCPLNIRDIAPESELRIHLYQALVKEKALDAIVRKTTELGVAGIRFFQSRYSQRLKPGSDVDKKRIRWEKIALEACKQSDRAKPPVIAFLPELSDVLQFMRHDADDAVQTICMSISGESVALDQLSMESNALNVLIGPEGGWDRNELDSLTCTKVHLGPRILRADTAAISAVGLLQYLHGDMKNSPLDES
ncbi:MAG: 16S rRNA (uracil(1498)-N(3))-methyltransferase [Proteobacteria bacterium]|nr:16S rRNA (uracil(1498)-N(3))-methyltransferase [Pseudomonadota bacterium]